LIVNDPDRKGRGWKKINFSLKVRKFTGIKLLKKESGRPDGNRKESFKEGLNLILIRRKHS
jgi:hypothetical protein